MFVHENEIINLRTITDKVSQGLDLENTMIAAQTKDLVATLILEIKVLCLFVLHQVFWCPFCIYGIVEVEVAWSVFYGKVSPDLRLSIFRVFISKVKLKCFGQFWKVLFDRLCHSAKLQLFL